MPKNIESPHSDAHMFGNFIGRISACTLLIAELLGPFANLHAQDLKTAEQTTTLTGWLVDDVGNAIPGAKLTVIDVWTQLDGHRERVAGGGSGVSDAEGRVTIENVPTERILSLRFSHPDFPRYWFEATTAKDPSLARKLTRWEIDENNFRKVFNRPRNVKLRLIGNDGKVPLPGIVIQATPAPDLEQIHLNKEWSTIGTTDEEGFGKLLLTHGRYELTLGNERPLDCIELNEPKLDVRNTERTQTFLRMTRRGTNVIFWAIDVDSHMNRLPVFPSGVSCLRGSTGSTLSAAKTWAAIARRSATTMPAKPPMSPTKMVCTAAKCAAQRDGRTTYIVARRDTPRSMIRDKHSMSLKRGS